MDKWWKKEERKLEKVAPGAYLMPLGTVRELGIRWLWPGRIVTENLTLLVGDPDVGKSLVALDLAARVSQGADWPDGQSNGKAANVILLSAEDHLFYTVRPALAAAGANMDRISTLWDVRDQKDGATVRRPLQLPQDMDVLQQMIQSVPECKLVVIDPITAYLSRGANQRHTLLKLAVMAGNMHVAVLGLAHLRPGGKQAMHRTQGGIALTSSARAVWMVTEDPGGKVGSRKSEVGSQRAEVGIGNGDGAGEGACGRKCGERRLLLPVKNNLVREKTGLAFTLAEVEGWAVPRVEWESAEIRDRVDEVLARQSKSTGPDATLRQEAMEYLREALANGPRLVKEIEEEAVSVQRIKLRTLERARKALKIKTYRLSAGGVFWMELPKVKSNAEVERKKPGEHGGQEENPGNYGTFLQGACPPVGGQGIAKSDASGTYGENPNDENRMSNQ
jgi:putative DNA primase/helicase